MNTPDRLAPQPAPQYVTDASGRRTAVILTLDAYRDLLEDLDDLAVVAERRDEPTVTHAEALAELRRAGLLDMP